MAYCMFQVLEFVRVAVQSRKVNLLSIDKDYADSVRYELPIDSEITELTISLSGLHPSIRLQDPDGKINSKIKWIWNNVFHCNPVNDRASGLRHGNMGSMSPVWG